MLLAGLAGGGAYAGAVLFYGTMPKVMYTGYQPEQPVPFSHKLHAGEMKIDCRYCHSTVDKAAYAAIPSTSTCNNCHNGLKNPDGTPIKTAVHVNSVKLQPVYHSQATGEPIEWEKIHDLADYVYFNHSVHVNSGVSCVSCHGRIDRMETVYQHEPLSMSWCLDCHRNPAPHIRPQEFITKLDWVPDEDPAVIGQRLIDEHGIDPSTNCSTCHR
ncbi:Class III cytochrome C family protein [Pseudobythopirellula maris]|uniref:Class III cytochrome C family protein n=1 Tax=Pseudobythopirellula maris TaxID=2527991 RepID=A0A5C5ZNZ8_9BACT|nr:cytochrome c3 family protein [Pseudobythopirellula maris]TWT88866.1 Class III cytochrome C family protein [Pseudobythopirellula maris]